MYNSNSESLIKWGASSRWLFHPNFAWVGKDSTTIGKSPEDPLYKIPKIMPVKKVFCGYSCNINTTEISKKNISFKGFTLTFLTISCNEILLSKKILKSSRCRHLLKTFKSGEKMKWNLYSIEHGRLSLNGFIEVGIPTTRGSSLWYCSVYCFNSWTAWDTLNKNFISRHE